MYIISILYIYIYSSFVYISKLPFTGIITGSKTDPYGFLRFKHYAI